MIPTLHTLAMRLTPAMPGAVLVAFLLGAAAGPASARVFLTQDEALELAFPDADVERKTAYLSEEDLAAASELAGKGNPVESGVISYYLARNESGEPVGVAYFDAHPVRTLPEVLMVVVDPDDRVRRVEVVRFSEPPEYMAPDGWIEQFHGRSLDPELSLKGDIANVTGATLTAMAVTASVRRVLATHAIIRPLGGDAAGSAVADSTADPR
jgi:Na+-translocating ferredoxin:NAD+ oxidoreductase RnfG subunit